MNDLGFSFARTEAVPISSGISAAIAAEPLRCVFEDLFGAVLTNDALTRDLLAVPRWERYSADATVSRLFQDTNLYGHALGTLQIAQRVTALDLTDGNISPTDAVCLWIVALVHDFGELAEGDVNFITKQAGADTIEREKAYFHQRKRDFFPGLDEASLGIVSRLFDDVAMARKKSAGLPLQFNRIEEIGYLSHALDMFELRPERIDWHLLCTSVMHYHFGRISRYASEHSATARVLGERADVLSSLVEFQRDSHDLVAEHLAAEFRFEGRPFTVDDCRLNLDGWRTVIGALKR